MTTNQNANTQTTTPQYCARVKTQDGYVLTKSLPLGELVELCKDSLAVDIIYLVEINPDGGLRSKPIGFFSVVFNKLDEVTENDNGKEELFNSNKAQGSIKTGVVRENRTATNTQRKETSSTPRKSRMAKRKNTRSVSRSHSKVGKVVAPTIAEDTLSALKAKFADLPDGEFEIAPTDLQAK